MIVSSSLVVVGNWYYSNIGPIQTRSESINSLRLSLHNDAFKFPPPPVVAVLPLLHTYIQFNLFSIFKL